MTVTITDADLLTRLSQAEGLVSITNASGEVIGTFVAADQGMLPPGITSPFTESEMAERRKLRTGRPLKDILHQLEQRRPA